MSDIMIQEGKLLFTFPSNWKVFKYDEWAFYRKHFQKICTHPKAVDIIALSPQNEAWLIEIKDYSIYPRTKKISLAEEVAKKVIDTLSGLVATKFNSPTQEKQEAEKILCTKKLHIALHIEFPKPKSKVFDPKIDQASLQQKLKCFLRKIDPHPRIFNKNSNQSWKVQRNNP